MAKPKVAIQGGGPNYLGKQPTVSGVPKKWKSSPDHPTAELAYITKEEKDILIDLDLYGSLKGKPNKGPGGIPSLQGDMGSATRGGFNAPSGPSGPRGRGEGRGRQGDAQRNRQAAYPGIRPGERIPEYRQRMAQQRRDAQAAATRAAAARRAAAQQAAAQQAAAARQAAAQQAAAQQAAAQQAAAQQAAQQAQEEAARQAAAQAAEQARQQAEQERLAAIEEQRRLDAQAAGRQRQAQALGTFVTTGPGTLNRPADPLPRYRGYTPMDFDVSRTGSLTDQYARMLNVPFFQPFIEQEDINLAPGATTADSIFGIESLMPTYTYDPTTGLASNPGMKQGGRVHKDMGGFIGFMDEPLNIMHPRGKIDVVDNGISSILKKYKEIRSEL